MNIIFLRKNMNFLNAIFKLNLITKIQMYENNIIQQLKCDIHQLKK